MALTKLGNYIEQIERRNVNSEYGINDARGISNNKELMISKADLTDRSFEKFHIVYPNEFVFNRRTTRMGEKIGLGFNNTDKTYIFTEDYVHFAIKENSKDKVLPYYLYMFFNRPEFDRYARYSSWGSSTEFFSWDDMCDVDIDLPPLSIQQKYVDVYNAMLENQKSYERGLDDLKLVCDAYIEDLRRKIPCEPIGEYIFKENKNSDGKISYVLGIGQNGFMEPQKEPNESLRNYKILRNGDIAYAPPLYNVLTGALHCYRGEEYAVCSPIYEVFRCDETILIPEYLTMWLKREEFKRYAAYYALGVRQTFDYSLMEEIKIPIPKITIQQSIVNIFKCYLERKEINEKLKAQIKDICPILIKGSIEEARRNVNVHTAV